MAAGSAGHNRAPRAALLLSIAALAPLADAQDAKAGAARAAQACQTCHGAQGVASLPDTPHLAGQPAIYLVRAMRAYRSGERRHEVMNVVAKPLSDADIQDLAAFYSAFFIDVKPLSR
jgi:cytochrome c553